MSDQSSYQSPSWAVNQLPTTKVWVGRVERKMKRKYRVELSLQVKNVEWTQTLLLSRERLSDTVQHPVCLQLQALIKATVAKAEGETKSKDSRTWDVQRLELLECPPEPLAIKMILQVPELWRTLEPFDQRPENSEACPPLEDYTMSNHAMSKRILLRLERRVPVQPRIRPTHVSYKLIKELEEMEQQVDLVGINESTLEDPTGVNQLIATASSGWNLPKTDPNLVLMSNHHKITRQEYLQSKKYPQIAWFLQRLRSFPGQPLKHIIDVGGGRGDLAIALAIGLGPKTHVTVVDLNQPSLEAGQHFAEQCGVGDQMDWVCDEFEAYAATDTVSENFEVSSRTIKCMGADMVVALHACGNLSDMALDFAVRQNAAFLICPCCYTKMENKTAASKIAELSSRPSLSRRAMHVINSKRYWGLMARGSYQILIEEYSREWSGRNMVLAGWPKVPSKSIAQSALENPNQQVSS